MHVLPGLMDTHTHLTEYSIPEESKSESDAWIALRAQRLADEMLRAGFTTVRDVGEKGYIVSDLRRSIEAGWVRGPTIFNAGRVIAPFGGQSGRQFPVPPADGPTWRRTYVDADGVDAVIRAVRENIYYGAKVIKIVADQKPYFYTEEELRAAVTEAHRAGLKVAVHLAGFQAARNAINAGVDSIEHGFDLTSADLQAMRDKGVFLSTTDKYNVFIDNCGMTQSIAFIRVKNKKEAGKVAGILGHPLYRFINNVCRYGNFNNIRVLQRFPVCTTGEPYTEFGLTEEERNYIER
jgi:imidazolonepropionase-like amidohydrolase